MKIISDNIKPILAIIVTLFTFSYFGLIAFTDLTGDPQVIIAVVSAQGQVLSYYFGSSTGTAKNVETISTLATKNAG